APTLREVTWVTRIAGGLLPALVLAGFLLRRLPRAAPAVVVMFVATPVVAYSRLLFGHMLAAACSRSVWSAWWMRWRNQRHHDERSLADCWPPEP
ncbi:MAG: hypothetical protein JKY37_13245, partial [Nannocystaceae bacterium]|nr:hypothetical protein [Nannocystaceae bacterium]